MLHEATENSAARGLCLIYDISLKTCVHILNWVVKVRITVGNLQSSSAVTLHCSNWSKWWQYLRCKIMAVVVALIRNATNQESSYNSRFETLIEKNKGPPTKLQHSPSHQENNLITHTTSKYSVMHHTHTMNFSIIPNRDRMYHWGTPRCRQYSHRLRLHWLRLASHTYSHRWCRQYSHRLRLHWLRFASHTYSHRWSQTHTWN